MTRNFLVAALYIAFVLAVALVALSAQSDASRALPQSSSPFIQALKEQGGGPTETPAASVTTSTMDASSPSRPPALPEPTAGSTHHAVSTVVRFLRGEGTWWDSWGAGFYVAVNPSDGIRVGSVIQVCDAHAQHCLSAPVTTTCACKGPDSGRIADLSLDLFSRFADPARGVTTVVLEVVE